MKQIRPISVLVASGVAALALLAACGGDPGKATSTAAPEQVDAPATGAAQCTGRALRAVGPPAGPGQNVRRAPWQGRLEPRPAGPSRRGVRARFSAHADALKIRGWRVAGDAATAHDERRWLNRGRVTSARPIRRASPASPISSRRWASVSWTPESGPAGPGRKGCPLNVPLRGVHHRRRVPPGAGRRGRAAQYLASAARLMQLQPRRVRFSHDTAVWEPERVNLRLRAGVPRRGCERNGTADGDVCRRAVSQGSYRADVSQARLDYYRASAVMTALPDHRALVDLPSDLDALRWVVQACATASSNGHRPTASLARPSWRIRAAGAAHERRSWST